MQEKPYLKLIVILRRAIINDVGKTSVAIWKMLNIHSIKGELRMVNIDLFIWKINFGALSLFGKIRQG